MRIQCAARAYFYPQILDIDAVVDVRGPARHQPLLTIIRLAQVDGEIPNIRTYAKASTLQAILRVLY